MAVNDLLALFQPFQIRRLSARTAYVATHGVQITAVPLERFLHHIPVGNEILTYLSQ